MNPLSNDLRERILNAVDNHEGSRRQIADRFGVNVSTITRLLQLRRHTGSLEPRPHGGGTAPSLDQNDLDRLRKLVEDDPDATLETLRQPRSRRQHHDRLAGLEEARHDRQEEVSEGG